MYSRQCAAALICCVFSLAACSSKPAKPREIVVAAAANLTEAAQALGAAFESQSGVHVTFSFASTAQLTSQIENGAPFDAFLAADGQHVDRLNQKGLLAPGSDRQYALGVLALWIPDARSPVIKIEDLASPEARVIAVAKPELAPYGAAAVEALRRSGVWGPVSGKIVYAENISMARQFGTSKNADAVFTAYSLVLKESGRVIQVDSSLYSPIVQKLGVVAGAHDEADAQKFAEFVVKGKGRGILASFGYK